MQRGWQWAQSLQVPHTGFDLQSEMLSVLTSYSTTEPDDTRGACKGWYGCDWTEECNFVAHATNLQVQSARGMVFVMAVIMVQVSARC